MTSHHKANGARTAAIITPALMLLLAGCGGGSDAPAPVDTQAVDSAAEQAPAEPAPAAASLPRTPAPADARVFIIAPADGATVTSPFTVSFGAENVSIVKAGDDATASGHHHLIINAPLPDFGQPVPASDSYIHFGGGQTDTTLELAPGEYELRLLLGDHLHIPHEPPVYSDPITVTVE